MSTLRGPVRVLIATVPGHRSPALHKIAFTEQYGLCHTPVVQTFRITPHRKGGYRIEAVAKTGGTEVIETHQTERAALVRLKILQEKAEIAWGRFATRQGCG